MILQNPHNKRGRPTYNPEYVLTRKQVMLIVAILLTDGSISLSPKSRNPSISFQNCRANKQLVDYLFLEFQPLIRAKEPTMKLKGEPENRERLHEQFAFGTVSHPQFMQFIHAFGGQGRQKTVPKVSYLMENLDWLSLAVIMMCDGAKKGGASRGMEIHLQSFSYQAQGRLCIALYHKFGIKAYPSYCGLSKAGEVQYHVQISGFSLQIIKNKLEPHMLKDFLYKIPNLGNRKTVNCVVSPWWQWYRQNKNADWLETLN